MNSILILNFSVLRTFGTWAFISRAFIRIFDSERVRLVRICLSSAGWRYDFGILSLLIISSERKIFASAPCEINCGLFMYVLT